MPGNIIILNVERPYTVLLLFVCVCEREKTTRAGELTKKRGHFTVAIKSRSGSFQQYQYRLQHGFVLFVCLFADWLDMI